jgi:hypothetical protein
MSNFGFDLKEVLLRVFKYVFEGFIVACAAYLIPGKKLHASEILTISLVAAATFSILDLFAPAFAGAAKSGAGFGIGANLVGFPGGGIRM